MLRHQKIRMDHLAAMPSEWSHLRMASAVISISILLIAGAILVAGTYASNALPASGKRTAECLPQPQGIVSWWRGEDGRDEQVVNHLTLQGSVNFTAGKVGHALSFDDGEDFAQVSQPAGLPVGNAPRTIELWFRTPVDLTSSTESALIQYGTAGGGQMFALITSGNAPGKLYFYGHSSDTWSTTTILPNTWYHGAVTYDGTTLKLYMNGQLETSTALGLNTVLDPNGLTIGLRHPGSQWSGEIDEPTIYDRALTDAEVLAIFNADSGGKCMANCVPAPAGLIGWWPAESNANDIIGGNDGLVEGNITFPFGKVARTFNFDGTTGDVIVPAASSIDVGTGPGMTIDMWIRPSSVTQMPLAEFSNANLMGAHLFIGAPAGNSGNLFANLRDTAGSSHYIQSANGIVNTQQWQHVALTYDKASGIAALYLNGAVVSGPSDIGSFTPDTQYDFNMGYRPSGPTRYVGDMDEVELFGRALTAAEIQAIYNAGSAGKCPCTPPPPNMLSWYRAEGNATDIVSGFNGTLQNGAAYVPGMAGQAFSFDGVDDYVLIPHDPRQNVGSALTIDAWVKINESRLGATIFQKRSPENVGGFVLETSGADPSAYYLTVYIDGNYRFATSPSGSVAIGTWQHIAGTYDGTSVKLYLDGELVATEPYSGVINPVNDPIVIGKNVVDPNDAFPGQIDEVEFFDRALSASEIRSIYNAGSAGKCLIIPPTPLHSRADFDGDNRTDPSVFRPSAGNWYLMRSSQGFFGINFGIATDIPVPADFDNDNKTDIAVARLNANGMDPDFFIINSADNTFSYPVWGNPGDVPMAGDYDGDGRADVMVWRPENGTWYIQNSTGGISVVTHGTSSDKPYLMDFDGDSKMNLAYFRPSTGNWVIKDQNGPDTVTLWFGTATDLPVPADYDGDGKDDIAVFRGGMWIIRNSHDVSVTFVPWGLPGDVPVPGDYDGDGRDDVAIYRDGVWHVLRSGTGYLGMGFGLGTDVPVPKAYIP